jgi:hypothetical protein
MQTLLRVLEGWFTQGRCHRLGSQADEKHVFENLAEVVSVVVDPLLEQVRDREIADFGMLAPPRELAGEQRNDQFGAVVTQSQELVQQGCQRTLAVAPLSGHRLLVPANEYRVMLGQDLSDATGEPAALGLDEVPQHFFSTPFAGRRMVAKDSVGHGGQLGLQRQGSGAQQRGDLGRGQPLPGLNHRAARGR